MDANDLSKLINDHLEKVTQGTKIAGKCGLEKKSIDHPSVASLSATEKAALKDKRPFVAGDGKYAEVDGNLFFFYPPATIVRWPKPVVGELKNFQVRILNPKQLKERIALAEKKPKSLTRSDVPGNHKNGPFVGEFLIESKKVEATKETLVTLLIAQPEEPAGIDIVVLGNPGGELGTNTKC